MRDPDALRRRLWAEQGERCFYCAAALHLEAVTLDHYIPRAYGGTDNISNLRAACGACNGAKGKGMPEGITAEQLFRLCGRNKRTMRAARYLGLEDAGGGVAQLAEHRRSVRATKSPEKAERAGSTPAAPINYSDVDAAGAPS